MHRVAKIVGLLHEREWNGDSLLGTPVDVHVASTVVHSHHGIVGGVEANHLPTRISSTGEEGFIHLFAQHTYLAMLANVHLVEIAAKIHFWGLHFHVVGQKALHIAVALLVAEHSRGAPVREHGRHYIQPRHLLLQPVDVMIHHAPLPSFPESLVGLGGGLPEDDGTVGCKACKVVGKGLVEPPPAADEGYEHEHAPEHAEPGEERTALVARQRVKDFAICVDVYLQCC